MPNRLPSVLFLDQPFAAGMVHIWIREYFFYHGFTLVGGEMPPWKEYSIFEQSFDVEDDYLSELDWEEMIRHTLMRLNGRYEYKINTDEQKNILIRCFKQYAKDLEKQFIVDGVDVVVIFGNYRIETKLAAYFCQRYQVQLVCIESFFLQNYFYLEAGSTQIANHHGFTLKWPFIRNFKVTDEQLKNLDKLMRDREHHGLLNDYINMPAPSQIWPDKLQKIQHCQGKVGLLLGQVAYDAVIVNDLIAFGDQLTFLRFIIEQFLVQCGAEDLLVCRLHPLEARYGDHTMQQLSQDYANHPQVLLLSDDDCNTYQLMARADFGIVANSQSGLEMIYRDKPVLVCGNPYYAVDNFCLQATDEQTIRVQIDRLLSGWQPTEKQLDVVKQYLCGLIFHHLCARNKTDVWQRLDHILNVQHLLDHKTLEVVKQRNPSGESIMPNGKIGQVKVFLPYEQFLNKSILVLGIGSFSQHLASMDGLNLTFCSDLPADCQQKMEHYPVNLFEPRLFEQSQIILVCWPQEKCDPFIGSIGREKMADKTLYRIEKSQQEGRCEFYCHLINAQ